jgi:hypothetical protein
VANARFWMTALTALRSPRLVACNGVDVGSSATAYNALTLVSVVAQRGTPGHDARSRWKREQHARTQGRLMQRSARVLYALGRCRTNGRVRGAAAADCER